LLRHSALLYLSLPLNMNRLKKFTVPHFGGRHTRLSCQARARQGRARSSGGWRRQSSLAHSWRWTTCPLLVTTPETTTGVREPMGSLSFRGMESDTRQRAPDVAALNLVTAEPDCQSTYGRRHSRGGACRRAQAAGEPDLGAGERAVGARLARGGCRRASDERVRECSTAAR
jgi:hypothetical protein